METIRPPVREPEGGEPEELEVEIGPGDPGVGERGAVPPQVGSRGEAHQRALDLREDCRVVGVGAQEAQRLVQSQHLAGTLQPPALERAQERELARRAAVPVAILQALEPPEQS